MKLNNKGVSLIALTITIIVIIIIAAIVMQSGIFKNENVQRSAFMSDLEILTGKLEYYNTQGVLRNNLDTEYYEEYLMWDGKSERTENSAQIEKKGLEDTPDYIFGTTLHSNYVEGKIKIIGGKLYIKKEYPTELGWAVEVYKYMLSGDEI